MTPNLTALSTADVIKSLNKFRKIIEQPTIKGTSLPRPKLEEMALKAATACANLNNEDAVAFLATKCPPAVAEGAYRSPQEAEAKTAHTMNGKTNAQVKHEARKEKIVEKKVAAPKTAKVISLEEKRKAKAEPKTPPTVVNKKEALPKGQITLADIARSAGITPMKARNHARRKEKDIVALQVSKTSKYIFPIANKAKVIKLITKQST